METNCGRVHAQREAAYLERSQNTANSNPAVGHESAAFYILLATSVNAAGYLALCSEQFPDLLTSISAASYLAVCSEPFLTS
jgi:hypothetical protein